MKTMKSKSLIHLIGKRIKKRKKIQEKANRTGEKLIEYYLMLRPNNEQAFESKTTVEFINKKSGLLKKQDIRIVIIPGEMEGVKK